MIMKLSFINSKTQTLDAMKLRAFQTKRSPVVVSNNSASDLTTAIL